MSFEIFWTHRESQEINASKEGCVFPRVVISIPSKPDRISDEMTIRKTYPTL